MPVLRHRWSRIIVRFITCIFVGLIALHLGLVIFWRGPHWIWKRDEYAMWISFPPLEFGLRQDWDDYSPSRPPGFIPDGNQSRRCWNELHHLYLLKQQGEQRPLTEQEVTELAELASYPDEWYVRCEALDVLRSSKGAENPLLREKLIGIFRSHLDDPETLVRERAIGGWAKLRGADSLPELVELFGHVKTSSEKELIVSIFEKMSQGQDEPGLAKASAILPAVPLLAPLLNDEDEYVRFRVALVLGQIGPNANAAVAALRQALVRAEKDEENDRQQLNDIHRYNGKTLCETIKHSLKLIEGGKTDSKK
jgi:HEAT repeat protein